MRLTSIQEELEQSTVTREELLKLIHDTVHNIKSYRVPMSNGTITLSVSRKDILEKGKMDIAVAYYPIEPQCYENMFKEPMEFFLKELFNTLNHTLKSTDPTILSGININYYGYTMFYKEGIINFLTREYLTNLDRVNLVSDINFLDAYTNIDLALSDLVIPMDRLPKFGEGYSLAMDKAIKRVNTIYMAHQVGKFRGLPYSLGNPNITILQNYNSSWDEYSRVLLPIFDLAVSSAIEYEGDQTELRSALIKKFEHFGILFN